jgi:TRAP-type mannitol/chloroaromatic compound transport system permease small subunit
MRYVFNSPTKWVFDISYMLGGSFFWLGAGYTMLKKGHIRIDIFYRKLSVRNQALTDIFFMLIFFFPLWGLLFYKLIPYIYLSWITNERSMQGFWMPIIYPFKTVMIIGVGLLLIQGIAEFMKSVLVLKNGENR